MAYAKKTGTRVSTAPYGDRLGIDIRTIREAVIDGETVEILGKGVRFEISELPAIIADLQKLQRKVRAALAA